MPKEEGADIAFPEGDSAVPRPEGIGKEQSEAAGTWPDRSERQGADQPACTDRCESGFSWAEKARVPLASFAQAFAISSVIYVPNIYISLFRANAIVIGLGNIAAVVLDIALNPLVGRLSDGGFFNRCLFLDVHAWGRRAPLMLLSIPICAVSCTFQWVGPESLHDPLAVALWYTMFRFLLTIGLAGFENAFQAGFTELFPSKSERVRLGIAKFVLALIAGGFGSVGVSAGALGVKDPGSAAQRRLFAIFGALTGGIWLLAIPYALLERRSLMKQLETRRSSFWRSMLDFWRSSSAFRFFAVSTHFYGSGFALTLSGLPFYFEVALGFAPEQVETAMQTTILGAGAMVPLSMPLVACMSNRMDPSKISGVGGMLCIMIGVCHAHASFAIPGQFWPQVVQVAVVCGAGVGMLSVAWASAQSALFTWIVDDDQVHRAEMAGVLETEAVSHTEIPARRDGMINSFKTIFSISAAAWAGLLQLSLGVLGYDGERISRGEPQPAEVRTMLDVLFILVIPLMFVAFAVPMFLFPIRGERLDTLMQKYTRLYEKLGTTAPEGS